MNKKKQNDESTLQFKIGAAIMSRDRVDFIKNSPNAKGALLYERKELEDNPYHGNLLMKPGLSKPIKTMFSASLAMCVEKIVYRK